MNLVLQRRIGNVDYVEVKNVHRRMELRRRILFERLSEEEKLSVLCFDVFVFWKQKELGIF